MPYTANIPLLTDTLDVSQGDLNNNFQQLDTSFGIDHVNFSDAGGDTGKHNFITMVNQTAAPTIAGQETALYQRDVSTIPRLFFIERGGTDRQMSGSVVIQTDPPDANTSGETMLFGGVGIKWGTRTIAASTTVAIDYTDLGLTDFPTDGYVVTTGSQIQSLRITLVSSTGFTLRNSNSLSAETAYWIAIGS